MAIIASSGGSSDFELAPSGNHVARCYRIVDMGSHKNSYGNTLRKILVSWELHGEDDEGNPLTMPDGKPLMISANYTLSLSEKATLRAVLESWRGKPFTLKELSGFDITAVLGHWCMVTIAHEVSQKNQKTYANVKSVAPVPAVIKKNGLPDGVNKVCSLSLDPATFDQALFDSLSDGIKKKIMESPEYKKLGAPSQSTAQVPTDLATMDDDVPF
jgi:hypothetical protein